MEPAHAPVPVPPLTFHRVRARRGCLLSNGSHAITAHSRGTSHQRAFVARFLLPPTYEFTRSDMAHLANYQAKDLYNICDSMDMKVSGTKAELTDRLKGKFTAEMARIFESYGGFEKKPGDATVRIVSSALCVSCTQRRRRPSHALAFVAAFRIFRDLHLLQ